MLLSYNRPPITWTLVGTGATWLTDASALTNGRPAAAARLQWLTDAQSTASVLVLRGTWANGLAPRLVGLIGLTLPVGILVNLAFRRQSDAGYDYIPASTQQRLVELPDGTRVAWFALADGLDPVIGVEFRLTNDVGGMVAIAAGQAFEIGEAWIGPTVELPHESDWGRGVTDPTNLRRSKGGQLFGSKSRSWRTLRARLSVAPVSEVAGNGLAGGADWERVEAALAAGGRCAVAPRWLEMTPDYLQRETLFCAATQQGEVQHAGGDLYGREYVFEEVPAKAAS